MKETQTQFIERYLKSKGISEEVWNWEYDQFAVFCDCEDGGGEGHWAMVSRNGVEEHVELYLNR